MTKRTRRKKEKNTSAIDTRLCWQTGEGWWRASVRIRQKRPASLTSQLLAAAHPFYWGLLSISRNLLCTKVDCVRVADSRIGEWARARFRVVVRPACRNRTDEQTNERMVGREFHTKHNPHIETQTQWPRQVGRGAVLSARARVRRLHPRVRAYVYEVLTYRYTCTWRKRERERKSEEKRWAHTYVYIHIHMVDERCTYGIT